MRLSILIVLVSFVAVAAQAKDLVKDPKGKTLAVLQDCNSCKDEQGKAFDRRTRFTDTFIKRDGRWQVWATQGTVIQ